MLKRSLTAIVTLGLAVFSVTVSLEAVGVLFHAGVPDPQQRVDAFVARLEAELGPMELPRSRSTWPQELAGHDVERVDAAEPALAGAAPPRRPRWR